MHVGSLSSIAILLTTSMAFRRALSLGDLNILVPARERQHNRIKLKKKRSSGVLGGSDFQQNKFKNTPEPKGLISW